MKDRLRTESVLALGCAAAAAILAASELMTLFEFTPPGGGEPLEQQMAADQHGYTMLVLAVFALIALAFAIGTGSRPASLAIAIAGAVALLIFVIGDLPDVNKIGALDDERELFVDAKAEPRAGFWLALIGSLLLTVGGAALATLTSDQLLSALGREGAAATRRRRPSGGPAEQRGQSDDGAGRGVSRDPGASRPPETAEPADEAFDSPTRR